MKLSISINRIFLNKLAFSYSDAVESDLILINEQLQCNLCHAETQ